MVCALMLPSLNTKLLCALSPHMCKYLFQTQTQVYTFMNVFMSPAERKSAAALMWQRALGTKDKQADESG